MVPIQQVRVGGVAILVSVVILAVAPAVWTAAARADVINVALTGTATQSSELPVGMGGPAPASRAIDGNTDGLWSHGSVTHTNASPSPSWWRVDLNMPARVEQIVLWNRTDSTNGSRLTDFRVSLFSGGTEVFGQDYYTTGGYPSTSLSIPVPSLVGDRVEVKFLLPRPVDNYLSLAEVQVFGTIPEPSSAVLLASSLLGLGLFARWKRK